MVKEERRQFPRIADEDVGVSVDLEGFGTVSHTMNLSASGMYCKVDKDIPVMSRVRLRLILPDFEREDKKGRPLEVDGVVVRGHPVIIDGVTKHYDIAVFFDNISQKSKDAILAYITRKKKA